MVERTCLLSSSGGSFLLKHIGICVPLNERKKHEFLLLTVGTSQITEYEIVFALELKVENPDVCRELWRSVSCNACFLPCCAEPEFLGAWCMFCGGEMQGVIYGLESNQKINVKNFQKLFISGDIEISEKSDIMHHKYKLCHTSAICDNLCNLTI